MVRAGALQLDGTDPCRFDRFRDKSVDVGKFWFCDLDVHASHDVDGIDHCFPVECDVIVRYDIKIVF